MEELLASLEESRVRPDAPYTRPVNFTLPDSNAPPQFPGFSFDLKYCPDPHAFTHTEACDLLSSFGTVVLAGDSFVRHVWDALLILISDDLSGAARNQSYRDLCRAELLFNDRELKNFANISPCRTEIHDDLETLPSSVCSGRPLRGKRYVALGA